MKLRIKNMSGHPAIHRHNLDTRINMSGHQRKAHISHSTIKDILKKKIVHTAQHVSIHSYTAIGSLLIQAKQKKNPQVPATNPGT
jgi:FAD synthase